MNGRILSESMLRGDETVAPMGFLEEKVGCIGSF